MNNTVHLLYVPVPNEQVGEEIANALLEQQLIACANLLPPGRSFYRWEGAVADEAEQVLILKTRGALVETVRGTVEELHPYSCPCVLDWPAGSSEGFAQWVSEQVPEV